MSPSHHPFQYLDIKLNGWKENYPQKAAWHGFCPHHVMCSGVAPWPDTFLPTSMQLQKGWGHPGLPTRPVSIAKCSCSFFFFFLDGKGASLVISSLLGHLRRSGWDGKAALHSFLLIFTEARVHPHFCLTTWQCLPAAPYFACRY